jgi:hypothetical protein
MWRLNQNDLTKKVMSNKSLLVFVAIVAVLVIYSWLAPSGTPL